MIKITGHYLFAHRVIIANILKWYNRLLWKGKMVLNRKEDWRHKAGFPFVMMLLQTVLGVNESISMQLESKSIHLIRQREQREALGLGVVGRAAPFKRWKFQGSGFCILQWMAVTKERGFFLPCLYKTHNCQQTPDFL